MNVFWKFEKNERKLCFKSTETSCTPFDAFLNDNFFQIWFLYLQPVWINVLKNPLPRNNLALFLSLEASLGRSAETRAPKT